MPDKTMPPDIIQTQKEVARKAMKRIETEVEYDATQWNNMLVWEAGDYDTVQTIIEDAIKEAIANIGRELEARCEGEKAKIHEEDSEAWGYKLLEEIGSCCPGDDAANVAEHIFDHTLTLIRSITGISPTR